MDLDHLSKTRHNLGKLLSLHDRISSLGETLNVNPDEIPLRLDVLDDGDALHVIAEVPGVTQDKLEVALAERELTIAGVRDTLHLSQDHLSQDHANSSVTTIINERSSGHFQRTISLPSDVDRSASTAQLRDGLLMLYLPKVAH
ncbi:MAG: Hsp20/alpha crystallin family protein [Deinococcota bacterium]